MTLEQALKAFGYHISGGSEYQWNLYGHNARFIDFADQDGLECGNIVHDTKDYKVYEMTIYVPGYDQVFKWIDPEFKDAYLAECKDRNIDPDMAYDSVKYIWTDEAQMLSYAADVVGTYYDNLPVPEAV